MDANKIKQALGAVHLSERSSSNVDGLPRTRAAEDAIRAYKLTLAETGVLLNALRVKRTEVNVQWGDDNA